MARADPRWHKYCFDLWSAIVSGEPVLPAPPGREHELRGDAALRATAAAAHADQHRIGLTDQ
eukprot:9068859-Alexandrium_andersonii.AAC.1